MLLDYSLKILRKIQWRVALWITGAFHMLPTIGVEVITELVLIYLHLKKLYQRFYLWEFSLLSNHIIKSILTSDGSNDHNSYRLFLESLTIKQRLKLKSLLINMDNMSNKYISFFSHFDWEFSSGNRLINSFSEQFFFYYYP